MVYNLFLLSISWGVLALLYRVLLQQETFFSANRAYLVGAALGSLVLPFLAVWLPEPTSAQVQWLPLVTVGIQTADQFFTESNSIRVIIAWIIYGLGVVFTGARTFYGLYQLTNMIRTGTKIPLESGVILVQAPQVQLPVSFFHYVLVPVDFQLNQNLETRAMLAHERAHALGRHSWDVLCMEVLCIVFWFHPMAHWYRRKLRLVHEYLADRAATFTADRKQYGLLLLGQSDTRFQLGLVNHFFQAPLKQRLWMLTRRPSSFLKGLKYLSLIPVLGLLWITAASSLPAIFSNLDQLDTQPSFPGGDLALMQYLAKNTQYPAEAKSAGKEGVVVVQFEVGANGQLYHFKTKGVDVPSLRAEAIRVSKGMPSWTPGMREGRAVRTILNLPIKFKLQ